MASEPFEEVAASDNDGLAGMFAAKIGDMAERYEDGSEPDVANSSLAELFAWCLVGRFLSLTRAWLDPASENR